MASFTKTTPGTPTAGFYSVGDTVTDSNGNVHTCTITGFAGFDGLGVSGSAQFTTFPKLSAFSSTNAITAFAGGGQGSATQILTDMARITTVATAADSVKLPAALPGRNVTLANAAAANSANVFPATGDAINALGANAAFGLAANKTAEFSCQVAGQWHAVLTA